MTARKYTEKVIKLSTEDFSIEAIPPDLSLANPYLAKEEEGEEGHLSEVGMKEDPSLQAELEFCSVFCVWRKLRYGKITK